MTEDQTHVQSSPPKTVCAPLSTSQGLQYAQHTLVNGTTSAGHAAIYQVVASIRVTHV